MKTESSNTIKIQAKDGEVYEARYMINAAGLDSLRIAQDFGFASALRMIPLKGRYAISSQSHAEKYKMLVYPVPVKGAYVLGVHSTITVDGKIKVGPTVFPAFAPENYDYLQGLSFQKVIATLQA